MVPCRNEGAHIRQFLRSLDQLETNGLLLNIIVADGMSTDGTRDILFGYARTHAAFRVVDNPKHTASHGLNQAIRQASGEWIVRMDVHTHYASDYVLRCLDVLWETGADNAGGPARTIAHTFWQKAIAAGFHSRFAAGGATFRNEDYRGPTESVPYGCWRKDLFASVGLFDETLARNQDDEHNLRIRRAGGLIWQDPSIVSYYHPRSSLATLWRQYFQYGFWRVAVLRKHRIRPPLRQLAPALAASIAALLIFWTVVAALFHAVAAERAGLWIFATLAITYLVLSAASSIRSAKRYGWDLLPVLPLVFWTYQWSYAAGFLVGLLYWGGR